jgi:hypothetical protein
VPALRTALWKEDRRPKRSRHRRAARDAFSAA